MIRFFKVLIIFGLTIGSVNADNSSPEIVNLSLNPKIVHTIGVTASDLGVTTLVFPGPLEFVAPAKVDVVAEAPGNKKVINPFIMAHTKGSYFITIKCHAAEGHKGAINVIYQRQVYVIKLKSMKQGLSSVNFVVPKKALTETRSVVTATKLMSAIDKAKAFYLLKQNYPEEAKMIPNKIYNKEFSYKTHDLNLLRGYRFSNLDACVFEVVITNKTQSELRYNPKDIIINLNQNFFPAALVDASGHVPPGAKTTAYIVISGHPNGGDNDLSLDNPFVPIITIKELKMPIKPVLPKKEVTPDPEPETGIKTIKRIKRLKAEE